MDPIFYPLQNNMSSAFNLTVAQISAFLPNAFAALIFLILGTLVAKWVKQLVVKSLEMLHLTHALKGTPIEAFLKNADVSHKIEQVIGSVVYWLFMLLVFHTTVSLLGLTTLTVVLDRVLGYIPKVISAVIILFLGMLVAGLLESLVKGAIKTVDGHNARLVGKFASYLTMIIFVLAAISELGIAEQFITILFIGFVATLTISTGLALGLGSKDVVNKAVTKWYTSISKELAEHNKE